MIKNKFMALTLTVVLTAGMLTAVAPATRQRTRMRTDSMASTV